MTYFIGKPFGVIPGLLKDSNCFTFVVGRSEMDGWWE